MVNKNKENPSSDSHTPVVKLVSFILAGKIWSYPIKRLDSLFFFPPLLHKSITVAHLFPHCVLCLCMRTYGTSSGCYVFSVPWASENRKKQAYCIFCCHPAPLVIKEPSCPCMVSEMEGGVAESSLWMLSFCHQNRWTMGKKDDFST